MPVKSANDPERTRTVEPGIRSLSSFSVVKSPARDSEAFLVLLFDLGATFTSSEARFELVSRCSGLRFRSLSCSSSKALSVFSCSSFACRNIASMSPGDTGLGLLICRFL